MCCIILLKSVTVIDKNAQTEYLNNFISRCNFVASWDHQVSKKEFTYANMPLNHLSCIDHIIMTNNIFDCISDNFVLHDPCNPPIIILYSCLSLSRISIILL